MRQSCGQRSRLAGSGARQNKNRTFDSEDGFPLRLIEALKIGRIIRRGSGKGHGQQLGSMDRGSKGQSPLATEDDP